MNKPDNALAIQFVILKAIDANVRVILRFINKLDEHQKLSHEK